MTDDECVVCGTPPEDFDRGLVVGELTIGDVNMHHGPICSRSCLFQLDDYPYDTTRLAPRFRPTYLR